MGSRFENLFMFMADVIDIRYLLAANAAADQNSKARIELAQKRELIGCYAKAA